MPFGKKDLFPGLFILGFSIFIASSALKLGIGTINDPGPGLFPFISAVFLFILSSSLSLGSFKDRVSPDVSKSEVRYGKVIFIIASLLGYSLLLDFLGFLLITFIFMFVLFLMGLRKTLTSALVGGIITTISVYILFGLLLGVSFPKGILGLWIK
jgi:putative tricarboxylic transport membrane protein